MIKYFAFAAIFLVLAVMVRIFLKLKEQIGRPPKTSDSFKFSKESNYNIKTKRFENLDPKVMSHMKQNMDMAKLFKKMLFPKVRRAPRGKLPEVKPNFSEFLDSDEDKVIWFGHSTFLIKLEQFLILVDPVFSVSASPLPFIVKRFQKAVVSLDELPDIDLVLLSHDHYDHLDMATIKYFRDKPTKFLTPLGVKNRLLGWGIEEQRITERGWWQNYKIGTTLFTATPSQHFSGRGIFDRNKTLWASWVIETKNLKIFYSGDSGYAHHFKAIKEKFGSFDVVLMENGQYDENWKPVHLFPEQGVTAFKELGGDFFLPAHWAMFVLSYHNWKDPIEKITKLMNEEKKLESLIVPKIGQILKLRKLEHLTPWWSNID